MKCFYKSAPSHGGPVLMRVMGGVSSKKPRPTCEECLRRNDAAAALAAKKSGVSS